MADARQRLERAYGQRVQRPAALQQDPGIVLAPKDQGRAADRAEERLDLGGVGLVGLRELAIEAPPARL